MTDKMREEFEAFAARGGESLSRYSEDECGEKYRDFVGRYVNHDIEMMWEAWKASRAVLCVDLPWPNNNSQDSYVSMLKRFMDEAGVRYR